MFRFIPYVLKTLWRHRARTVLTASGAAVAIFVFCFVGAVQEGMNDLRTRQESQRSLIVFQANKFCPATSHLPQDYDQQIAEMQGVADVTPIQVFTNNCRASLDVVIFYGLPPEKLPRFREFDVYAGGWADFARHQDAALVGSAVAARRGINVGDNFTIGGVTVNVAGLYSADNAAEENYIYTHLDFLQRRRGKDSVGTVTQFEIALAPGANADVVCEQIDDRFRGGPVETDTRPKGVFQARSLGDLAELISLAHYLGFACVGLVLALVATTTLMAVQDRVKEYAVLQTIGFTSWRVFAIVLCESVVLSLAGGAVGIALAMAVLQFSDLAVGAEAVTIAFRPSLRLALIAAGVALVTGFAAGVAPAWQASRSEIVPALRQA